MGSRIRLRVLAAAFSAGGVLLSAGGESLDGDAGGGADLVVSGVVAPSSAEYSDCSPSGPLISFPGGYSVSACFEHEEDGAIVRKDALDYGLGSERSGLLYFFERDNAEILVKVLDGCAINGHRWVFVAPVTTLAFNLRIDEAATGRSWKHWNPRGGRTATTASDVAAFPCSGASANAASAPVGGGHGSLTEDAAGTVPASLPVRAGESATCVPEAATTLDGGYTVRMCVEYEEEGAAAVRNLRDYGLDSGRSALLYAFERDNAEVLVKVLDGCAINGHRWVFVAPVTTLAFNLSIDPPGGGAPWRAGNDLGRTAAARSDLSAFPCGDARAPEPPGDEAFRGRIAGFRGDPEDVEVMLMAEGVLRAATPDAAGWFQFRNLAAGKYAVKIHAAGHRTTPARLIDLPSRGRRGQDAPFDLTPIPSDPFVYHWEEDQSTAGREYSAAVNRPVDVVLEDLGGFGNASADVVDHSSANRLRSLYNMILVDTDEGSWTQEHAWRLLATMSDIPQPSRRPDHEQRLPRSRWLLTPEYLEGDIQVSRSGEGGVVVRLTEAVFVNAERRVARVEGRRGVWFSKRLHHALVRYVTDNGRDQRAYERIFQERYGVTTVVDDYVRLTAHTTGEDAGKFQKFHPREIVALLTALEEFPSGMHKTPGLDYLVRRLDGLRHPVLTTAGAVAWPYAGYVEFMESGFQGNIDGMQRLILHEKSHFLWEHAFDRTTKDHWIETGGWYETGPDKWQTTKQTEFVSAYAHKKNPNEDMAETLAWFVFNPDKLRSRSPAKYEFVRDRIMQGNVYVSRIREDLTFPVYNLYPDYVFPGKVRRVDIRVEGGPREDKRIRVEVELHAIDRVLEGASRILTRVSNETGSWFDFWLRPVDEAGRRIDVGTVLVGEYRLDKSAKAGYWTPEQFKITDPAGNQRFARGDDFGWKLYVENAEEDWIAPEYVPRTARLDLDRDVVEGRAVQTIGASWAVKENRSMGPPGHACLATLNDEIATTYSLGKWGAFDSSSGRCGVTFIMPDYMPSSSYSLVRILMKDAARNSATTDFTDSASDERPRTVRLVTSRPDTEPPELDLNRIEVEAEPTKPDAPNGETIVRIRFRIRDDISGYNLSRINLRDPQGVTYFFFHKPDHYNSLFPKGDPTAWITHDVTHVLPPGSAPGIWGIYDMTPQDRAGNFVSHDFTEVLRFEVDD